MNRTIRCEPVLYAVQNELRMPERRTHPVTHRRLADICKAAATLPMMTSANVSLPEGTVRLAYATLADRAFRQPVSACRAGEMDGGSQKLPQRLDRPHHKTAAAGRHALGVF